MHVTYILMWRNFGGDSWHFDVCLGKDDAYGRRDRMRAQLATSDGGVALVLRGE